VHGKWIKKEKPKPLNVLEKEKQAMEDWKIRAAFWARRKAHTAQPRKTQ
jgi:hypothetical protein